MYRPVTIVSLGPGDPDLLTLGAWRVLRRADIVFCPATRSASGDCISRAGEILAAVGIAPRRIRFFEVPMSRDRQAARAGYRDTAEAVGRLCRSQCIAVAAEGDAGIYSSVHYIGDLLLDAGVPVHYFAGVPAFVAAGALAGLHIVRREQRLVVMPAPASAEELTSLLDAGCSVAVMKLSQHAGAIRDAIRCRRDLSWHYFEQVGTGRELHLTDPDEILARPFPYFSLLIAAAECSS